LIKKGNKEGRKKKERQKDRKEKTIEKGSERKEKKVFHPKSHVSNLSTPCLDSNLKP
jgi:hypothetical protein